MSSGADLFVVCKQCGSEVSPYITECPYCGHRLRRRAPKLPRAGAPTRTPRSRMRLRRAFAPRGPGRARLRPGFSLSAVTRPYATIALVAASCVAWILWHANAKPIVYSELAIIGPLHGDWWKLFTNMFAYQDGLYAFVALLTIAIFGRLIEQRHGVATVLALFFGGGATGALVATAVYPDPIVSGGNGAGRALLAAWAAADIDSARRRSYYEGDLLGTAAIALLLLAMPWARAEGSWLAGLSAGAVGLM